MGKSEVGGGAVKVRFSEKSESLMVLGFWAGGNKTWTEVVIPETCHSYIQILVNNQSTTRLEFYLYNWDQCVFIQPQVSYIVSSLNILYMYVRIF